MKSAIAVIIWLATATVASPTRSIPRSLQSSDVSGVTFDRIIQIWLENEDFSVRPACI